MRIGLLTHLLGPVMQWQEENYLRNIDSSQWVTWRVYDSHCSITGVAANPCCRVVLQSCLCCSNLLAWGWQHSNLLLMNCWHSKVMPRLNCQQSKVMHRPLWWMTTLDIFPCFRTQRMMTWLPSAQLVSCVVIRIATPKIIASAWTSMEKLTPSAPSR